MTKKYSAAVNSATYISPKVIHLQLTPDTPVDFTAGQYASLIMGEMERLYSFASDSDSKIEFVIDISPAGPGSAYIKNLKNNDRLIFLAPFGRFTLNQESDKPLLFLAAGTGIGPIRAQIMREMSRRDTLRPITLVLGNRNEDHALFHDEFVSLQKNVPTFRYFPVLSKPLSKSRTLKGRVTDFISSTGEDLSSYDCYICGKSPMVLSTMASLRQQGVPEEQIHVENFT